MVRGRLHGIARYALELARHLPRLAPGWELVGLTGPEGLPELGALTPELPLERCAMPFLSPLEQPAYLASLLRMKVELFHATSFSLPGLWPGALVATLHDANHLALKEDYGLGRQAYYRLIVGPRARTSRALITVSEFSRRELARHLDLNPFRLQVIPQGVDPRFAPPAPEAVAQLKARLGLPAEFALTVGNAKPFKNLSLLVRIAQALPLPLVVLAGPEARELGFPPSSRILDEVPEALLPTLYGAARMLLFPSTYEGFGLPALEAMACGCPVVAAHAGSLPEVVGDAGLLLEPHDEAGWAEAVRRLQVDLPLRETLLERGLERAARYGWEACARKTLAVYARVLGVSLSERP